MIETVCTDTSCWWCKGTPPVAEPPQTIRCQLCGEPVEPVMLFAVPGDDDTTATSGGRLVRWVHVATSNRRC